VAGGAQAGQQYLAAGLLDEIELHVVPVLLGGGVRLFENVPADEGNLEIDRVIASPAVTHVRYRVLR
jgi:dihydrofolate reductase